MYVWMFECVYVRTNPHICIYMIVCVNLCVSTANKWSSMAKPMRINTCVCMLRENDMLKGFVTFLLTILR